MRKFNKQDLGCLSGVRFGRLIHHETSQLIKKKAFVEMSKCLVDLSI